MNKLKAGFARVNITPNLGVSMSGYFEKRYVQGALDDLELSALAVATDDTIALLISVDVLMFVREIANDFKESITKATGVPADCIYIHGTHIHTGCTMTKQPEEEATAEYLRFLTNRMAYVAKAAIEDMKPAKMGWAVGKAPNVAFIRRYRMKDGSIRTNPGINNPDVLAPIGEVDDRVNVLRFDREGAESLVLVNFGNHPDVIGGEYVSADWPGFMRRTVERALPECKCIFFNGCQGDVNHVNTFPKDTDRPLPDFTKVPQEKEEIAARQKEKYEFSRYMGRAMAGTVLQEYDKVKYIDVEAVRGMERIIHVPSNMGAPEELEEAKRLNKMYREGRIKELRKIYPGMMFETTIARANRIVALENGPEYFEMNLSAVAIGKVVMIGLPGEPFTPVGKGLKETDDWDLVLPTCTTNGAFGYFPMMDSYEEGGYEANSSRLKAGSAEFMMEEGKKLLRELA